MEEKNIFINAEGAFKAIEDAIAYLGNNGYVEGFMVLNATEKSGIGRMMQVFAGTELNVAANLIMAAQKCEAVKDVIEKVGRIIEEKWEECEAVMAKECELQEEAADE